MQTIDELIRRRADDRRVGTRLRRPDLDPPPGGARPRPNGPPPWPRCAGRAPSTSPSCSTTSPSTSSGWGEPHWPARSLVGGNPTHRGDELARDLSHTECQLLVTNSELPRPGRRTRPRSGPARRSGSWSSTIPPATVARRPGHRRTGSACLAAVAGCPLPDPAGPAITEETLGLPAVHLGHLGGPQGLPVQPGTAGPHRVGIVAQMFELTPMTSATWPCRSSTPTR